MPESANHIKMVESIKLWIENNFEDIENFTVWTDSPNSTQPVRIEGFVPDVYAKSFLNPNQIIIGEAKTARDIDTKHTELQLSVFLKHCSLIKDAFFILAVPWDLVRYAGSLIKDLQIKCQAEDVKITILEYL